MTRKETLRKEYIEKLHELETLQLKELTDSRYVPYASSKTIDEWASLISNVESSIKSLEREKKHKEFLETEEGFAIFEKICAQKNSLIETLKTYEGGSVSMLNRMLKREIGEEWKVRRFSSNSAEIAFGDEQFNRFDIYFERSYDKKEERFEFNVGTTGSFNAGGSRAQLYIGIGKILADTQLVSEMKRICLLYHDDHEQIFDIIRDLNQQIENLGL